MYVILGRWAFTVSEVLHLTGTYGCSFRRCTTTFEKVESMQYKRNKKVAFRENQFHISEIESDM